MALPETGVLARLQDTAGSAAYASLAQLPGLTDLSITCTCGTTQSFRWLTQITSLSCRCSEVIIELPQGSHIPLQRLYLFEPSCVKGLADVTQLTCIDRASFHVYDGSFPWPACLPCLKEISLDCIKEAELKMLPQQWQNYPALRSLSIAVDNLPDWFTVLQCLTKLQIDCADPPTVPASLSKLCGLERLIIHELWCDLTT